MGHLLLTLVLSVKKSILTYKDPILKYNNFLTIINAS
jgi:hypothetical protein